MIVPGRLAGLSGIDTLADDHRYRGTYSESTVSAELSTMPRNHRREAVPQEPLPLNTGIPCMEPPRHLGASGSIDDFPHTPNLPVRPSGTGIGLVDCCITWQPARS